MEFIELFKRQLASTSGKVSQISLKNYLSDIRHFIHWFEATTGNTFNPTNITADIIELYSSTSGAVIVDGNSQQEKLSSSSMKRHLSSLRKFMTVMEKESAIDENPFEQLQQESQTRNYDYWHFDSFKEYLLTQNASKLTVKNYLADIRGFAGWYEQAMLPSIEKPLTSTEGFYRITQDVVEVYKNRLIQIQSSAPRTINRKLSSLRRYLEFATKKGFIAYEEIIIPSVKLEQKEVEKPTVQLSELNKVKTQEKKSYSAFPPIRLLQKLVIFPYLFAEEAIAAKVATILSGKEIVAGIALSQVDKLRVQSKAIVNAQNQTIDAILGVRNVQKQFYAPHQVQLSGLPLHKKIIHHAKFTRPKWYKTYHSYPFVHYAHFAILIIFAVGVGVAAYQNLVGSNQKPTFAAPTAPPRILSFQGRLTDANDNPITSATDIRFGIYNDITSSGSALLWQEVHYVVYPDQDGIFSVLLGTNTTIPSTVFSDNAGTYLGVSINQTSELTPRQRIASVAYATNSEQLQGMQPITAVGAGTSNVVLALDSSGNLTIGGAANPSFSASGGQFRLSGQPLLLTTNASSNGDIILSPDGLGKINLQKPLVNTTTTGNLTPGGVEVNDKFGVLATESAVAAFTVNNDGSGDIITASASGTTRLTLGNTGSLTLSAYNTNGGIFYANGSGILAQTTAGSLGQCLQSIGGGTPTWGACGGSSSSWRLLNGALSPTNDTLDLLIGSNATSSAKFGFLNVGNGTPTASISANSGFNATTLSGDGILGTTNKQTLSIGNSSTGNVILNSPTDSKTAIGTTSTLGTLKIAGNSPGKALVNLHYLGSGQNILVASNSAGTNVFTIEEDGDIIVGNGGNGKLTAAIIDPYLIQNQYTAGNTQLTFQTMAASNGDFIFQNQSTELARLVQAGQFQLPITGSTGGLLLGGDVQLFRGAANRLDLATGDSFNLASGNIQIGETTVIDSSRNGIFENITINGTCTGCVNSIDSPFQVLSGAIVPRNSTQDFLIGGQATNSAKFAVLNVNSGTPIASISAGTAGGSYLSATGTLATTANQTLTLGNNTTGNITIGTDSKARTISTGNNTGATALNFTSGTGSQTFTSNVATGTTTTSGFVFDATALNSGTGMYLTTDSITTGKLLNLATTGNTLTSGTLLDLRTTATSLTGSIGNGSLLNLDWSPGSATIATGDLFALNIGINGTTTGNLFNILDAGSSLFSVSETAVTSNLPTSFNSAGDVSIAYDLIFTNPTASYIKSSAPLYIQAGELFNSTDLTLGTYNKGNVIVDSEALVVNQSATISSKLVIGTSTAPANISNFYLTNSGTFGKALAILNQTESQDIISASSSGIAKFVVTNGGSLQIAGGQTIDTLTAGTLGIGTVKATTLTLGRSGQGITLPGFTTNGGLFYANGSGVLAQTSAGTGDQCLLGGTTPTWGSCSTGGTDSPFQVANGAITPHNSTLDFLLGGQATSSAKFAVLNVNSGTPTASVSAGTAGAAFLTADGNLSTTARQSLTIGNSSTYNTTGNVLINPNGIGNVGIGTSAPEASLHIDEGDIETALLVQGGNSGSTLGRFQRDIGATAIVDIHGQAGEPQITFDTVETSSPWSLGVDDAAESFNIAQNTAIGTNDLFTILTSGRVGIGTTGPDRKLDILDASAPQLRLTQTDGSVYADFQVDSNGDLIAGVDGTTNQLVLDNGGNVGIGLTNPGVKFAVGGTPGVLSEGAVASFFSGNDTSVSILSNANNTGQGPRLRLFENNPNKYGTELFYDSGANSFAIVNYQNNSEIGRIHMDSGGKVGIGTSSPLEKLDVAGNATVSGNLTLAGGARSIQTTANNSLTIGGTTTGNIALMPINGNGNVGIGTTTPRAKLDVIGTGNVAIFGTDTLTDEYIAFRNTSTGVFFGIDASLNGGNGAALIQGGSNKALAFQANDATFSNATIPDMYIDITGNVGINTIAPTALLDVNGTASISGALKLYGSPTLQSTANQTLTIGGNTTGNIVLSPINGSGSIQLTNFSTNGGLLYANASGVLAQTGAGTGTQCLLGGTTPTFGSCATGTNTSPFEELSGAIVPNNSTLDFLLGSQATSSAEFAITGINNGTPTATISATTNGNGLSLNGSTATIQSLRGNTLNLGGTTTGLVNIINKADSAFTTFDTVNSRVGIGTSSPDTALDVRGSGEVATFGTSTLSDQYIRFRPDSTGNAFVGLDASLNGGGGGLLIQSGLNKSLAFSTDSDTFGATPHMTILENGNIGIGTEIPDRSLEVLHATNPQLRLTQTDSTNYADFQVNASGDLTIAPSGGDSNITGTLDVSGHAAFGSGASVQTTELIRLVDNLNDTSGFLYGINSFIAHAPGGASSATIYGLEGQAAMQGSQNLTGSLSGIKGGNSHQGSGTVTNSYAGYFSNSGNSGGGTITNNYGIYIEDMTSGSNDYGLAIAGADTQALWISSGADNTDAANGIAFGSSRDTNLYRSAANTLRTDDAFNVNGNLNITSAGAISAATGLTSSGTITFSGFTSNGGVLYTNGSGVLAQTGAGSSSQCLLGGTTPSFGSCATGINASPFQELSGAIIPNNSTLDFLIGGQATSSAKFAVLNINTGTPTASVSAGTAGAAFLTADGNLSTTARQTLTIGNSSTYNTTGNVLINPNGTGRVGIGTTNPVTNFQLNSTAGTALAGNGFYTAWFQGPTSSKGVILGYDSSSTTGILGPSGTSGNLAFWTHNGTAWGERMRLDSSGNVGIGDTSPASLFTVGSGDLFQVNSSGAIAAATGLSSSGTITFSGFTSNGGILYTNGSGVLAQTGAGTSTQCLLGGTTPTFGSCATGSAQSNWRITSGALSPINDTLDLLVGSTSSSSAKFAVLNIASGTPVASVSSGLSGNSAYLTSDGTLATQSRQTLTIGNSSTYNTTGNVLINPNGTGNVGIGTTNPLALLNPQATTEQLRLSYNASNYSSFTTNSGGDLTVDPSGGDTTVSSNLHLDAGAGTALYFDNASGDAIIRRSTSGILALSSGGGTTDVRINYNYGGGSGGLRIYDGGTTNNVQLQATSGNLVITPSGGNVGIGTTTPTAKLDVNGTASVSGALKLYGTPTIQSTANNTLTLGGDTTGNIVLSPLNGSGTLQFTNFSTNGGLLYTNTSGILAQTGAGTSNQCLLGGTTPTFGSCATGTGTSPFQELSGAIIPNNSTLDFLIGGQATASAKFAVLNVNGTGPATATVSGNLIVMPTNGGGGNVGIGTISPNATLEVARGKTFLGTQTLTTNNQADVCLFSNSTCTLAQGGAFGNALRIFGGGSQSRGLVLQQVVSGEAFLDSTFEGLNLRAYDATNGDIKFATGGTTTTMILDTSGRLGIGTTSPASELHVTRPLSFAATGKALAIFDQIENQDILTASASGTTKLIVTNGGSLQIAAGQTIDTLTNGTLGIGTTNAITLTLGRSGQGITLPGFTGQNGILYGTSGTGVLAQATTGSSNQCLLSGVSNPSWGVCPGAGAGSSNWVLNSAIGALYPINTTLDVLIGGSASDSAKFAFINNAGGTPTASISANSGNNATFINGLGNLGTTNAQTLTLGGSTTGNVVIDSGSSVINLLDSANITGDLAVSGTAGLTLSGSNADITFTGSSNHDITASSGILRLGAVTLTGTITGGNQTINNIGNVSANSSSNILTGFGTIGTSGTTAFTGTTLALAGAATDISSATNEDLTITANGSGNIVLTSDFNTGVKIGTSSNIIAPLSVSGGIGSNAGFILDQLNSGDLFVASAAGSTRFVLSNTGSLQLTGGQTIDTLASGTLGIGTVNATTLTLGRSGQGITLPGFTGQNGVLFGTSGTGVLAQATTASLNQCLLSGAANPSWGTCPGAGISGSNWTLDTTNGIIRPNNTTVDFVLGGTATASAKFAVLNIADDSATNKPVASVSAITGNNTGKGLSMAGDGRLQSFQNNSLFIGGDTTGEVHIEDSLFLGINESLNGGLTFFSSGAGETDPTITADASGNLILTAPTGTVQVGSGTGSITVSLANAGDVFIADKTVTLAGNYSSDDFTFKRVLTGGANDQGGSVVNITDISGGSGTINGTLLKVNSALTSGNFTGNLGLFQQDGVDKLAIQGSGTTPSLTVTGQTAKATLIVNNTGVGDLLSASASGVAKFSINNAGGIKLGTAEGASGDCLKSGGAAAADTWGTCLSAVTYTASDGSGGTSSGSGLENGTGGIGMLQGCADDQVLKWNDSSAVWECGSDRATFQNRLDSDFTLVASTTFTDVDGNSDATDDMGFVMGINETWIFQMNAAYQTPTAADQKWQVTGTGSPTCDISFSAFEEALNVSNVGCGVTSGNMVAAVAAPDTMWISGTIVANGSGSTVQLQFGQATASGTSTIFAGSYVIAYKITGADLAENYYTTETPPPIPGTLLSIDEAMDEGVKRSQKPYDKKLMGVVTTKPGLVMGEAAPKPGATSVLVALSGRVPMRVNTENGNIEPGDYITSSSTPGVGMKATKAGAIVGQALMGHRGDEEGTIVAMVRTSYSQGVSIASIIPGLTDEYVNPEDKGKRILEYLIDNTEQDDSNLSEIFTDRVVAGLEIITPKVITQKIETQEIVAQNATISGTLTADVIKANRIEGLEFIQSDLSALTSFLATSSASLASQMSEMTLKQEEFDKQVKEISQQLEKYDALNLLTLSPFASASSEFAVVKDGLAVLGTTTLNEASIENTLSIGNTMMITSNSLNVLGSDLEIQSLRQGGISFLGGLISFDSVGKAIFKEDVAFEKNVSVTGVLSAKTTSFNDLTVEGSEFKELSKTEAKASSSAGTAFITTGETKRKINTPLVKDDSLIYLTPIGKTFGQYPYIAEQKEGESFTVKIEDAISIPLKFNYLIINKKGGE